MKNRVLIITTCLIGAGLLAVATFVSVERKTLAAEPPTDPAHAAHVAAAASQADGQTVDAQLAEMGARIQQLEAIIQQQPGQSPPAGAVPMSGKPGMGSGTEPMQGKMAGMSGMGEGNPPSGGASGAMKLHAGGRSCRECHNPPSGGASGAMKPAAGTHGMGGGASPPGGEMGMGMMDMDKMEMAGMMGSLRDCRSPWRSGCGRPARPAQRSQ